MMKRNDPNDSFKPEKSINNKITNPPILPHNNLIPKVDSTTLDFEEDKSVIINSVT